MERKYPATLEEIEALEDDTLYPWQVSEYLKANESYCSTTRCAHTIKTYLTAGICRRIAAVTTVISGRVILAAAVKTANTRSLGREQTAERRVRCGAGYIYCAKANYFR